MLTALLAMAGPLPPILPEIGMSVHLGSLRRMMKHCSNLLNLEPSVVDFGDRLRRHGADATNSPVISMAGVGFQLAALALAPEHGWLTEAEAETQV